MRKVKLEIESLTVESFEPTGAVAPKPGIVRAHDAAEMIISKPISDCLPSACATCGIYC